jgi:hypothetical protein
VGGTIGGLVGGRPGGLAGWLWGRLLGGIGTVGSHTTVNVTDSGGPGGPLPPPREYGIAVTVWVPHVNLRHEKTLVRSFPQKA